MGVVMVVTPHNVHWNMNPPSPQPPSPTPLFLAKPDFSEKPQNIKTFSSIIPSYLLNVTKFLGEISQFEFEENIFAYKLFLSLNISDFIFFM